MKGRRKDISDRKTRKKLLDDLRESILEIERGNPRSFLCPRF
jgi:hypothetical protein